MMQSSIHMDRNVEMKMRDGTVLRADICRPDDNQKHPAILTRSPYNKVGKESVYLTAIISAVSGYARVIQDLRGRFASDGEYGSREDHWSLEAEDGYDTVEWIASQPWCDGNVGMIGTSYDAVLQYAAAMACPPHLKAIAPDVGTAMSYTDQQFFGGPPLLGFQTFWNLLMGTDMANKLEQQGKDVTLMRQMLDRGMSNPEEIYYFLPLKDVPHFQFDGLRELWQTWVLDFNSRPDPGDDPFWPFHKMDLACLHSGGWFDVYNWSTFKCFLDMREKAGSQSAREHQHIYIGPWKHGGQSTEHLGDLNFGALSAVPELLVGREPVTTKPHMDFFNKYLRGMDVEVPAVRYFVMGKNVWRTSDIWPLAGTQQQRFFLHSKGGANTAAGDGLLSRDEPRSENPDRYDYDPSNPVPTVGGRMIAIGGMIPGPREQSFVEKRSDVLCYTTPELKEDTEVTGPLELHLFAATSAVDTDFNIKLNDVFPDGRAYLIADGAIRARCRKSAFRPEPVTPGEVNEYTINMGYTSNCYRKGHRIRLDITSSNFPYCDRNMNTGNPVGEDVEGIVARQTIFHQAGSASYIDLPVIVT